MLEPIQEAHERPDDDVPPEDKRVIEVFATYDPFGQGTVFTEGRSFGVRRHNEAEFDTCIESLKHIIFDRKAIDELYHRPMERVFGKQTTQEAYEWAIERGRRPPAGTEHEHTLYLKLLDRRGNDRGLRVAVLIAESMPSVTTRSTPEAPP